MGLFSGLFGSNKTVITSKIFFDDLRTHGKISVSPGYDIESSLHLLVLFQISKMLYVTPKNYAHTKDFIKTYFDVCDDLYVADNTRFKVALQNTYEQRNNVRYFFMPLQNAIETFESELIVTNNICFNFQTKIPLIAGRTDAALSTPLVMLALIQESEKTEILTKIQRSVRLMCGKYLSGLDWTNIANCQDLPLKIFDMSK